jgi:hypothetical protein
VLALFREIHPAGEGEVLGLAVVGHIEACALKVLDPFSQQRRMGGSAAETEPEPELNLLLQKLKLELPAQPPPKIIAPAADPTPSV